MVPKHILGGPGLKKSVFDAKKIFSDPRPLPGPVPRTSQISGFRGPFGAKIRKIGITQARHDVIMQTDHFLNAENVT